MALSTEDFDALVAKRVAEIKANHKRLVAQKTEELRREREARPPLRDDELFALPTIQLNLDPLSQIDDSGEDHIGDHDMLDQREPSPPDSILGDSHMVDAAANVPDAAEAPSSASTQPLSPPPGPRVVARASFRPRSQQTTDISSTIQSTTIDEPRTAVGADIPSLTVAQARVAAQALPGPIKKKARTNTESALATSSSAVDESAISDSIAASRHFEQGTIPEWYEKAKRPKQPKAGQRTIWEEIRKLGAMIAKCQVVQSKSEQRQNWQLLYQEIDNLRFTDVTPYGLKQAKVFDKEHGLQQLYDKRYSKGAQYPFYIVSDAKGLHKKWLAGILDGSNMFRGIRGMIKTRENSGGGQSIDEAFKLDWRFYGDGHLVNGDWFANQLCAVRDGAHGSPQGGISGLKESGATSISLSGDIYVDVDRDELDQIWYSGTVQTKVGESEPTTGTKLLLKSEETKQPVRVLRSMHLPKTNLYKPIRGFRYDGLYEVRSHRLHDPRRHHYVFHLVRRADQDPVRYKGIEIRPTQKEIDTYDHEMKMFGKKKGYIPNVDGK